MLASYRTWKAGLHLVSGRIVRIASAVHPRDNFYLVSLIVMFGVQEDQLVGVVGFSTSPKDL